MTDSTRRTLAILASAALTASLATATLASDVDAAKRKPVVKCDGKVATKVGTKRPDVIRGTARKDVIAGLGGNDIILGRGGNDTICGGAGNDRLVGGPGHDKLLGQTGRDRLFGGSGVDKLFGGQQNDFLAGQDGPDVLGGGAGSDRLDGGIGVDLCSQGTGHGPMVRCELPRAVFAPPAPPAPTGPTLHDLSGVLAIAYSDIDVLPGYSTGDVLIAKLLDAHPDGQPGTGDVIKMGRFPKDYAGTAFGDWGVHDHHVSKDALHPSGTRIEVASDHGIHAWNAPVQLEVYWEVDTGGYTSFDDAHGFPGEDVIQTYATSPSKPPSPNLGEKEPRMGDDPFVDVEILYTP